MLSAQFYPHMRVPRATPWLLLGVTSLLGCSGSDASLGNSGGVSASLGGASSSSGLGGGVAEGGAVAAGTTANGGAGGSVGLGGAATSVGTTANGGASGVGGTTSKGGTTSTGTTSTGTTSTGGISAGGSQAKGGTTSSVAGGGTTSKGGTASTAASGGTPSKGGTTSSGGTPSKGGTTSSGGTTAKGGTTGSGGTTAKSTATFRNPLNTAYGSDPFMTYYNGYYYLAATTWGTTLTMKRGATVQALKSATTSVIWTDSTAARSGNMWAPEFYLLDNGAGQKRWYHYYTAGDGSDLGTQRSYVLESDGTDPMGPYHFKAQLLNYWAIDGSLLQIGTQLYFMFSAWDASYQKIWIIAMTNPWTVTGARTQLSMSTYDWEKEGTATPVTNNYVNEGPNALYHGGRTFVTYSASQCGSPGYKLGMLELIASNPLAASSWSKSATPVFQTANAAYGSGHNGFFKSPDGTEDWIVYHATTNAAGSCWTDRTTRIQRIAWNANGTPNFGVPLALSTDIVVPSGE